LITACETVLIQKHQAVIQEEFQSLLDFDKNEDLTRMFNLLSRVPSGLDVLREKFEEHVKKQGLSSVEKVLEGGSEEAKEDDEEEGTKKKKDKGDVDPKTYVDALLSTHRKYAEMVSSCFSGEPGFVASFDKAVREFVNRNVICRNVTSKTAEYITSKSPELLAKFCDAILRKTNKGGEELEIEDCLNSVMTVFKYVEDKDVFQKFYSKMLAKRLVNSSSVSDDAETSMIGKLKEACGFEYISKLQKMFQDIGTSKDLDTAFK
jgi:cullin 1